MPITLPDGSTKPTPEETVVALLEQGVPAAQIIADAKAAVTAGEDRILAAEKNAAEASALTDDSLKAQTAAQEAINRAKSAGASSDLIDQAEKALRDSALSLHLAAISSADARVALTNERGWANEMIQLAQGRIAAASDPKIVDPAVKRYAELKAAEKRALEAAKKK